MAAEAPAAAGAMIPQLESCFPIRVEHSAGRGRVVRAARSLAAGSVILANAPAAYFLHSSRNCAGEL